MKWHNALTVGDKATRMSPVNKPMKYPEFADLSISNHYADSRFDALDGPPPPMTSSEGVVALDITQDFFSAAASRFALLPGFAPALTQIPSRSLGSR